MSYILHIDTSADTGLVALSHDGKVLSSITNADTRNHAAVINLHIEQVLADAGITMQHTDAVAVCGGPGSYTGLRIGLATAKGLCYVLDKPLMMHSKLLLMSLNHYYKNLEAYEFYAAILTARDKEYYFATYNNKLEAVLEPQHVFEDDLPKIKSLINGKTLLTGNITDITNDIFCTGGNHLIAENGIDITSWATYGMTQFKCHEFVNLAHVEPFYLKQVFTHNPKNIN